MTEVAKRIEKSSTYQYCIWSGVRLYPDSGRNDIGTPDSCIDGNAGVGAAKLHCIFQGIFCGIGRICHV